ncbi:hypothetical protein WR25_01403 [Diploscapter pachys]|uniref:Uncharacterized protein n=1 Tax=Diploscapter pachys TaxID=2018661 RepID=A0A2A2LAK8_9BILA|nr:hypothetical protein WR25_01403 [Diploscapter pachys]
MYRSLCDLYIYDLKHCTQVGSRHDRFHQSATPSSTVVHGPRGNRDSRLTTYTGNNNNSYRGDRGRDIFEKIVLGLPDSNVRSGEVQFGQRLFDQSKGLDSGGIDDETYSAYDAPWRADNVQQHLYRPSKNIDKDVYGEDLDKIINTNRFVPNKGFSGTEGGAQQPRSGPVQFERDQDVFGLGELFQQVNKKRLGDSSKDDRGGEEKRRRRE